MRNVALAVLLLLASRVSAEPDVAAELERITNELLDAIAPGDAAVWNKYAHERLIFVTESNEVLTKEAFLAQLQPLPKGLVGKIDTANFQAQVHGDTAVTTYIADEWLDYHGQIIENDFRISDTWLRTAAGWRLIASQVLAVLEDPPAVTLPRETLCAYNGTYRLTPEIVTTITCTDGGLASERTGRKASVMKAEVRDVFFTPGAPRTRRIFERDARGAIAGFVDRREGLDVRWTKAE